jgi:hypothetical protein
MHFLTSVTGNPSGGDAGGVTGVVNSTPPGLGDGMCLFGIWMGIARSLFAPGICNVGVDIGVAADWEPCSPIEGGGVGVLLDNTTAAMAG